MVIGYLSDRLRGTQERKGVLAKANIDTDTDTTLTLTLALTLTLLLILALRQTDSTRKKASSFRSSHKLDMKLAREAQGGRQDSKRALPELEKELWAGLEQEL